MLPGGAQPFVQALRQLLHLGRRAAGDIHRAILGYVGIFWAVLGYLGIVSGIFWDVHVFFELYND